MVSENPASGGHGAVPPAPLEPSVEFIGTATTLLRIGPFTVLTDPNFLHRGQYAWLGHGLVSKRLTDPALRVEQLPDLDLILLSHLHGDHWDRVARRGLDSGLPIVTTQHASVRLKRRHGFPEALGLATWQSHTVDKADAMLRITSLPGEHAHGIAKRLLPPVMGSLIELFSPAGEREFRLYVTGDTLMFDGIHEIARRYGDIDAAIVHLGGTKLPGGLVVTMDGEQGCELLSTVQPGCAVPVHYGDYGVFKSPLEDFRMAARRRGLEQSVRYVDRGERAELRRAA
jgi:L-ascorbate metabolism protein UlaG (beta-lactamase superfamily)